MIGLTGNQIQNDIDNPKVIGSSLTGSQTAQLLNDTRVISGKEMLISEPQSLTRGEL